ncbi:MAG: hypothetical protein JWQ57_4929 [Mucilaginibacter sp.]|nr:hypothetical protein [Mucilaginibacter sp.]
MCYMLKFKKVVIQKTPAWARIFIKPINKNVYPHRHEGKVNYV